MGTFLPGSTSRFSHLSPHDLLFEFSLKGKRAGGGNRGVDLHIMELPGLQKGKIEDLQIEDGHLARTSGWSTGEDEVVYWVNTDSWRICKVKCNYQVLLSFCWIMIIIDNHCCPHIYIYYIILYYIVLYCIILYYIYISTPEVSKLVLKFVERIFIFPRFWHKHGFSNGYFSNKTKRVRIHGLECVIIWQMITKISDNMRNNDMLWNVVGYGGI